jgi:hypothetical protein
MIECISMTCYWEYNYIRSDKIHVKTWKEWATMFGQEGEHGGSLVRWAPLEKQDIG